MQMHTIPDTILGQKSFVEDVTLKFVFDLQECTVNLRSADE